MNGETDGNEQLGQPLSYHERFFFDVNGYVVRHNVLSPRQIHALNARIDDQRLSPPGDDIMSQRFAGMLEWGEEFLALLDHPEALAILRDLIEETIRLDHVYGIHMDKGHEGLGIHGGGTPFDPSQYYLHRGGRMHNGLVAVMWGLSESNTGDGGFCCIPGSHKAFEPVPSDVATYQAHRDWVTEVPLPPGSMLVFTEALAHGTLPWMGEQTRRAIVYKYAPGHMAWAPGPNWREDAYGPMPGLGAITPEIAARLGGRRRALLHPPYIPHHPSV